MAAPSLHYLLRNGYHLSKLSTYLDWFNVMAYDMGTEWTPEVGSHTDMAIVDDIVQYFLSHGVPSEKIVLGLAAFGRTFTLEDPLCDKVGCPYDGAIDIGCGGSRGYMPFFFIDAIVKAGLYKRLEHNPATESMELVTSNNEFISYDNFTSFETKISYAQEHCLRGYMWWAVDMFYDSFVLTSPGGTTGDLTKMEPTSVDTHPALPTPLPDDDAGILNANSKPRCGSSEVDAREHCRPKCASDADCGSGLLCYETQFNYCDDEKFTPPMWDNPIQNTDVLHRCGRSEVEARSFCQKPCGGTHDCDMAKGEWCHAIFTNFCGSNIAGS
mmetsp:Transcript_40066/g.58560  ORF Transcript_40066/g.58560 Transcript_40066/m.58560 type:complete len:327 (+) Transcript_40066:2525-3505(+)